MLTPEVYLLTVYGQLSETKVYVCVYMCHYRITEWEGLD